MEIKEVYDSGRIELNGRTYEFLKTTHAKRLKVFGYANGIKSMLASGDMSFYGTDEWLEIEKLLFNAITIENSLLSKLPDHFEKFGEDYIALTSTALSVFSYPFIRGSV